MKKTFSALYMVLIFLFLYAPIALMIFYSFNSNNMVTIWEGFTFDNYISIFSDDNLMEALKNSLMIALLSSVGACILGTLASLGINNLKKTKSVVMNISNLPIINPEIVTGISLMLIFIFLFAGNLGFVTVLLAHIVFNTPYIILNVLPRIRRMDKNLYEAALDLGCKPWKALIKVVLPEIFPGIFAGFLIAFTYSIDDFVISYFTGGTFQTLSVYINNSLKKGIKPWMLSLSGLIFISVLVILIVMNIRDIKSIAKENNSRKGR